MSRHFVAAGVVLTGLLAAAVCATALRAQQPAAERGPPKYRRIFVPEDELEPLVKGLLPVKREEFERRLAEAGRTAPAAGVGPRIARASYTARLSGQNLVDGEARLEIAAPQEGTGALALAPCNLALGQGKWEETPPRRAVLGSGPRSVLVLEVDKAGTVSLPWTRHGEELEAGSIQFDLALPESARQELRLRLPPDLQLSAEPGLVWRLSQPSAAAANDAQWLVQPGGGRRVTLRVFDKAPASGDGKLVLVKEQARYALSPTDVACEFQWQVDVHGEALRTAQLRIDPRLQVTSVSVGGQTAAWSVAGDEKSRTLSVEFTQPLSGGNHGVSIQAICEQSLGKPWRLPRLNWQGAVWQEGSAVINVPSSLQIAVTGTSACRATKTTPPAAGGESLAFQYHSADGYVEVEAVPLAARLTAATGITIQFEATQVSATLRADLAALAGEAFEVDAVVSSEWILDAVETEPADLLEDRPVVAQDERSRTMRLKFQRPITPPQPLRLIVRARRQQPLTGELSTETLWRWFSLRGMIERPAVMSLRSNIANYDLQVSGDVDAARLDPEAASSEELSLLDSPPSGLLFRLPAEAADFRILLRAGEPRFTAAWDVSCAVSRSRLRQQATVRCIPSEPGLSRLVVSSRPPPQREIRWRVAGAADVAVVAQTRADTGPSAANPLGEAEWELELSRPLSQPFTLESNWEEPRTPRQTVPLFSSRNATSQTGVVRVTAEDDSRWSPNATQLVALPVTHDSHRFTTTRGLFRYESGQRASLVIAAADESALLPLARLTAGELVTQFAADGSALNVLALSLENTGLLDLAVSLPDSAALQDVAVDGRPVDPLLAGSEQGKLRIPLPAEARRVAVRISYATGPQAQPLYVRTWRAELPTLNLATPAILWHVALPPGMSAVDEVGGSRLAEQLPSRFWGLFLDGLPWIRWLHPWQQHALSAASHSRQRQAASDDTVLPESTSDAGWSVVSRQAVWSPALTLEVCRPQRSALLGLALLLAGAGLVLATGRRWLSVWFLAAVALAAVTLIVPPSAAPLAAGAFWGIASGSMAALLRPAAPPLSHHGGSRLSTTRWVAAASASSILVLAWLVVSGAIPARAAPPDSEGKNVSRPAQRVVIPVDDDQKPTGDYVFVEGEFYDWLLSQPQRGQPGEPWQLRSAVYDVRWPDSQVGGTQAADVRASLEIETFADDAQVTLPLKRKEVLLQSGGARLDGMALNSSWRESGSGLICVVPTPGKYRLELAFSSPLQEAGQQRALSLSIPRAPTAVARVSHPSATAAWTSPTALGAHGTEPAAAGSSWQVDLGSTAELTIQTNVATPAAGTQPAVEAEQLLWWKVRPGSVVVDAVCKFRPLTGALGEVQLRFDPSLRLFSLDESPQLARHWVENGAASTLHVVLTEPTEEEVVIRPRFLLAQASGIGKIVPPRLEAVAPRISRHWMAVTPGPGLELVSMPERASAIAEGEFVQAWGPADVLPQAAFNLAAIGGAPALELRPETRQASATAETTVICSLRLCRLRFQADLTGLAPHHMQQRVALPPGWSATQVIVRDGDLPVRSRWFQEPDGTLVARLDQPPAHSLRMQIDAALTPPAGGVLSLPAVRLLEVSDAGQTLRVLRGHDCDVQVAEVAGWVAGDASQIARHQEGLGRLVANLRGAGEADGRQLTLRVTPNRPQVQARLVTRYSRESPQGAEVVVICDLAVSDGKLDALRLEAPREWSGPWETSPPLAVRNVAVPGQATRHVTLIPELPLSGQVQLTIKAPLKPAAGEPVRLPDIAPLDLLRVERLVQWPKQTEGDTSKWNSSGLQAAPLPPDLSGGLLADPAYETLAVVAPHFDAVLTAVAAPRVEPLVSLVEYRAAWRPPGVLAGEAIFRLDVSSLGSLLLELPPQHQLTFATLDGLPAEVVQEKEGRFRVRPSGLRLPQRLVVGFEGRSQLDQGRLVLSGPALVGLPARATIWSLAVPDSLAVVRSDLSNEGEIVQLDQDQLRLEAAAELLGRAATRDVTGISSEALAAWLRPWRADATLASQGARATLRTIVKDDGAREAAFLRVQTQLDGYWQTLPGGQQPVDETAASGTAVSGHRPGTVALVGEQRLGGAARGPQPQVALELVDPAASRQAQRLGAALLTALLGVAACLLARWSAVDEWLTVSGPFLLAGGGVALACFSPLGIAALAITLLAVAMAWRTPWSHPADPRHSSIVVLTRHSGSGTVR